MRAISRGYLFVGTIIVLCFSILVPPFAVQDEPHHFDRSVQISQGGIIGTRYSSDFSGGKLPLSVQNFGNEYLNWIFNADQRGDLTTIKNGLKAKWGGPIVRVNFSNTVIYPPIFYLPSALSVYVTRHLRLPIIETFYIGRVFSGLVCLSMCVLALAICAPAGRLWLAFILCIPEIYQLFSSYSQDGGDTAVVISRCSNSNGAEGSGVSFDRYLRGYRTIGSICNG